MHFAFMLTTLLLQQWIKEHTPIYILTRRHEQARIREKVMTRQNLGDLRGVHLFAPILQQFLSETISRGRKHGKEKNLRKKMRNDPTRFKFSLALQICCFTYFLEFWTSCHFSLWTLSFFIFCDLNSFVAKTKLSYKFHMQTWSTTQIGKK